MLTFALSMSVLYLLLLLYLAKAVSVSRSVFTLTMLGLIMLGGKCGSLCGAGRGRILRGILA